jgi:predicted NUDIX family NTP pyrophosphohydrolase
MKYSAGIIPFRTNFKGELEFFVGHPGGIGWHGRNYWAYLKGGVEKNENYITAAIREFKEESGLSMEDCKSQMLIPLGTSLQNPKKTVIAYGLHYPNINPSNCHSNMADNGRNPEIDAYRWLTYEELKKCTHPSHLIFYETLIKMNNNA